MEFKEIKSRIELYKAEGKRIFTSSSFQTHSIPLLHIISRIDPTIPVVFLNTGFHFSETIVYRDEIVGKLGLNLIDLKPKVPKSLQLGMNGKLLFTSDPDHCCDLNKTQPMEKLLMGYDVWIIGLRSDQSETRKNMSIEEDAPHGVTRFHPIISWTNRHIWEYRKKYNLPEHPLDQHGYMSIGCEPCTRKLDPEMQEREARWYGMNKTECGLHTELIGK